MKSNSVKVDDKKICKDMLSYLKSVPEKDYKETHSILSTLSKEKLLNFHTLYIYKQYICFYEKNIKERNYIIIFKDYMDRRYSNDNKDNLEVVNNYYSKKNKYILTGLIRNLRLLRTKIVKKLNTLGNHFLLDRIRKD